MLRAILNKLFGVFKPLEIELFSHLQEILPEDIAEKIKGQLGNINLVQRLMKAKEVNLYCIRKGVNYRDDSLKIPYFDESELLAYIIFEFKGIKYKVKFYTVNGFLFSLVFNKSPKKILHYQLIKIIASKVVFNFNGLERSSIEGLLPVWFPFSVDQVVEIKKPLTSESQKKIIESIDAELPKEYISFLKKCDGAVFQNFTILGFAQIREVVDYNNNLFVLAENEEGAVLVQSGKSTVFYLNFLESERQDCGSSFLDALNYLNTAAK